MTSTTGSRSRPLLHLLPPLEVELCAVVVSVKGAVRPKQCKKTRTTTATISRTTPQRRRLFLIILLKVSVLGATGGGAEAAHRASSSLPAAIAIASTARGEASWRVSMIALAVSHPGQPLLRRLLRPSQQESRPCHLCHHWRRRRGSLLGSLQFLGAGPPVRGASAV